MAAAFFWLLALVGHGAFWVEIVNRLHGFGWRRDLVDAATAACGLATIGMPCYALWRLASGSTDALLAAYGWFSIAALAVLVGSRLMLFGDPHRDRQSTVCSKEPLDLQERLGDAATGSAAVRRLSRLPGNQLLRPVVEEITVPIDRLPAELDGLRVAHLTDLHMSGRLEIAYFQEVVRRVNEWSPDLVCVTGDIVEHTPQLDWVGPTLGELSPGVGKYFILGNHDQKVDCRELRQRLTEAGLVNLGRGAGATANVRGIDLSLCGDERPWFGGAPKPEGEDRFTICLTHTPDQFDDAVRRGDDLLLAGHNHGGQVCFPLLGALLCPSRHGVRYASGTFRRGRTVMHVSRGTGSLFPLRYLCPPEITLLTLTCEKG